MKYIQKHYSLGIIANQIPGLEDRLKELGIIQYFAQIISSAEVGVKKPNLEIFLAVLRMARAKAENLV